MLLIKKRYIFLIIIICLFSISAASAEEMDNITAVDNHESPNSNFLADSYSAFGDLENEIYDNAYIEYDSGKYMISSEATQISEASNSTESNEEKIINISAPEVVKYFRGSERFVVTLTDGEGNPIPDKVVIFTLNGAQYTRTTDSKGNASLAINLNAGVYAVAVKCDEITVDSKVTILSTVHGSDVVKIYGNDTHYYATFLDSQGKYLPKGIFVQFMLNDVLYNKEIIDDKGSAMLEINEKPGTYVITALNPFNSERAANNITVISNIAENNNLTKYYNGTERFRVRVVSPTGNYASGEKVKFIIANATSECTSDSNGYAYLNALLNPGEYIVRTSYNGNEVTNVIKIIATLVDMNVSSPDIDYGETEIIKVSLPFDAIGKVTATVNGKEYSGDVNEGVGSIEIPNLNYGNYDAEVSYSGDLKYNPLKKTTSFAVLKTFDLSAPDVIKYYGGSERFVVTLKETNGRPIGNAKVSIYINSKPYTRTTDSAGSASMAINLNSGKYNITVEYDGIKINSTVTVKDTVISKDFTKIFRNDTQYYATFVDSRGNILKNTPVRLNINGVYYTRTTSDQGIAKMNINLIPGTYILTAENPASGEQHTTLITVLPSIVENHDLTKYYRNESKYTLRILGADGKPVGEGVTVKLNINGVFYERKTNASGYMNMNINLIPGTYIVTAEYNGLMASNTVNVLPVLSAKDVYMKYRDGTKFEIKLLDGRGNPFAAQKITFNINGVFYERITDENGIARLNINLMAGEYIITSMYENGAALSNKVTVSA